MNATGSAWKQASRDIKNYLQDTLDIQADALDPSGRFVHGSRSIMLANYALRINFDPLRLQQFATLMRHSLGTMNAFYLLWTDWTTAKIAMADFNKAFGLPDSAPITRDFSQFDVVFTYPKDVVETEIEEEKEPKAPTTTEKEEKEEIDHVTKKSNKKRCEKCNGELRIYGPYGKKSQPRYGCYWYQCISCIPIQKTWIPLGFMTEYSCSRKSKNHDEIIKFIKASLT